MRLILNADDLGYSPGVNQAILALAARGRLSSTSLVVNLPHSQAGVERLMVETALPIGIHLNLTRGEPCLPARQVASLVEGTGRFWPTPRFLARVAAGRVDMAELEVELRAQIDRALAFGVQIQHLDSHSHWQIVPALHRLVRRLAVDYQVPRVRAGSARRVIAPGLAGLLVAGRRPGGEAQPWEPDYLMSLHHWVRGPGTSRAGFWGRRLQRLLAGPETVVELVTHPGLAADPDFPQDTLPAGRREWEVDWIQSELFDRWLERWRGEML